MYSGVDLAVECIFLVFAVNFGKGVYGILSGGAEWSGRLRDVEGSSVGWDKESERTGESWRVGGV